VVMTLALLGAGIIAHAGGCTTSASRWPWR